MHFCIESVVNSLAAANSTKKTSSKAKTPAKKSAKANETQMQERRRLISILLVLFGALTGFLTYIKGDGGLWTGLYNLQRGLFGDGVYLLAPMLIYLGVFISKDKCDKNAIIAKLVQGLIVLLLVCGMWLIFAQGRVEGATFFKKLGGLYSDGVNPGVRGGGLFGAVIGWTLLALFKSVGSKIIIVLLTLLFLLMLTNLTIPQIAGSFSGFFKAIYRAVNEDKIKAAERAEERRKRHEELKAQREKEEAERKAKEEARSKKRVDIKYDPNKKKPPEKTYEDPSDYVPFIPEEMRESDIGKKIPDFTLALDMNSADSVLYTEQKPISLDDEPPFEMNISGSIPDERDVPDTQPEYGFEEDLFPPEDIPEPEIDFPEEEDIIDAPDSELDRIAAEAVARAQKNATHDDKGGYQTLHVEASGQTSMIEDEKKTVWTPPPIDILKYAKNNIPTEQAKQEMLSKSDALVKTLTDFGVHTTISGIFRGPSVTRYELKPDAGVKISKITNLDKDIALCLAANGGVRIEAPIIGKNAVGIEVPNTTRDTVSLRELIDSEEYRNMKHELMFAVGKDIEGKIVVGDISKMPHMLIAGTTGSGKSVFTNSIIINILYHASPDDVKLVLIDPKKVEFPVYNGIPHLLIPVVTEADKAVGALGWAVNEMMMRYNLFEANGVKNLEGYNAYRDAHPEKKLPKKPKVVIIVDEFADLMLAAKNEAESSVQRLAQLARAAGMHLIIATQSPRADIITGVIKANIPSRTALSVSNNTESRIILDEVGAEKLLGNGDLLFKPQGARNTLRVQSGFCTDSEIMELVEFLKNSGKAEYSAEVMEKVEQNTPRPKEDRNGGDGGDDIVLNDDDSIIEQAIQIIAETQTASTSYLQRKLKLGYARAGRIMDELEDMGFVGPANGAKGREVRITREQWLEREARK